MGADGSHELGAVGRTKEPDVHGAAEKVVRQETGLVIADFSPRNIERLRTFRDIARSVGRRLIVTVKDAYLLEQMNATTRRSRCLTRNHSASSAHRE